MRVPSIALLVSLTGIAAPTFSILKDMRVRIPMRDRIHLSAHIFRPSEPARVPTVLIRTPYDKGADVSKNYQSFLDRGYAVVIQDVRGRYDSEGVFNPMEHEGADGDDTINWIASQPWSDGNVGMIGGSYVGIVQWKVALHNNPHLKAIFPVVSGSDDYRDRFYSPGGAMKLGHRLLWMSENMRTKNFSPPDFMQFVRTLPLRNADRAATGHTLKIIQDVLDHPGYDAFWKSFSTRAHLEKIRTPVFAVGGWYDNYAQSDLETWSLLRKQSNVHRVLIGPWPHNMSIKFSGVDYGPESQQPIRTLQIQWFDQWLKHRDTPLLSTPPVKVFIMGVNRWREEREWPITRAKPTQFFLESRGHANSLKGNGALAARPPAAAPPDRFIYDPRNPVPTHGGAVCCNPKVFAWGPMDQRTVEARQDVLVYTTGVLRRDIEVTGPIRLVLFVSTSQPDTDFTAKLIDVFPDGEARNLTDGILRLRYRNSLEKAERAKPGEIYRIVIDAGVTGNVFLKGHRIRLEVSSSNFPRFDRNPNTGRPVADETELRAATQTIYHDAQHPSHLLLPVIP